MATVSKLKTAGDLEWQARVDLAAAFRWFARLNMHESVANHLSYAVTEDGTQFLINPRGRHFSRIDYLVDISEWGFADIVGAADESDGRSSQAS